ncbi:MAG: hypothetical protein P8Y67_09345 [Alphaproteobacteria bacterium]
MRLRRKFPGLYVRFVIAAPNLPHPPDIGGLCGSIVMYREFEEDIGVLHRSSQTRKKAKRQFIAPIVTFCRFKTHFNAPDTGFLP